MLAAARTDAADRAQAAWGSTSPVLVAVGPIAPGDPLAGRVTPHRYPSALAPPGALAELPPDAVARQALDTGDPLRAADVAGTGPLALVPDGWVVAPVVESPRSGAEVGDRVQVVSDGVVLADSARVVGFVDGTGETVTLVAAPEGVAAVLPAARPGDLALLRLP